MTVTRRSTHLARSAAFAVLAVALSTTAARAGVEDPPAPLPEGGFASADFGRPFLSEIHSSIPKIELGYNKSYAEYNLSEGGADTPNSIRPVTEIHIGFELPIYVTHFGEPAGTTAAAKPAWSFSVSLPLSVHVLEDMFEPVTAPVIDADYRFGLPKLSLIHRLSDTGWFRNVSLNWFPGFHESTHLGDEIVIYRKEVELPITRINLSYEFTELQLTLNDPDGRADDVHSLRLGLIFRLTDRGLGWFDIHEDAANPGEFDDLPHSDRRWEYYIAYQFQRTSGWLASPTARNVFSVELRNRVRYGVPRFKPSPSGGWDTIDVQEAMALSVNAYAGWRFHPNPNATRAVGFFLHAYRGLNPYGQLRNYPSYGFVGFSITYEP